MNFLSRSSQTNEVPHAAAAAAIEIADRDNRVSESSASSLPASAALVGSAGAENNSGASEDARGFSGSSASMRTRMAIQDHSDLLPDEGSILIPFKELPEGWYSAPDIASLAYLDRPFVFPGEQFHVVIHLSVHDSNSCDVITPFKVAAAIERRSHASVEASKQESSPPQESLESSSTQAAINIEKPEVAHSSNDKSSLKGKWFNTTHGGNLVATTEWLSPDRSEVQSEGHKRRSLMVLESFKKSHFHVKIRKEGKGRVPKGLGQQSEQLNPNGEEGSDGELESFGCQPVVMEHGEFEPATGGGIARAATACWSLENGDAAVVLRVSMPSDLLLPDAELEVLQFEPYETPSTCSVDEKPQQQGFPQSSGDPSEGLLQWLLPLDRPSSPPQPTLLPGPVPSALPVLSPSTSGRMSFSSTGTSTFFSFSHSRNSSLGSVPLPAPTVVQSLPPSTPMYGPEEWGHIPQDRKSQVGSEGLLSFRGAALEPQRFATHCGLPGSYLPGKRWKRKVAILQPVQLQSYVADCNTEDLICVLVENVLPPTGVTADVVIYIDSVSIVCQSAVAGGTPMPIPVACVEVGEHHTLPGLTLRAGEQHSFILRPINPTWKPVAAEDAKSTKLTNLASGTGHLRVRPTDDSSVEYEAGHYAVLVSCRCSHSEARLHFKHSLMWRPRPSRDLLLSVTLESCTSTEMPSEILPQLSTQVVKVQATNLTSQEMYLTLLAPSSLAASPLSVLSFPSSSLATPLASRGADHHQSMTVREVLALEEGDGKGSKQSGLPSFQRRLSLPPVQPMELVLGVKPTVLKERIFTAADAVADNTPVRTHLWLQSTVPLGRVPPHATTAVRCDLLPLTSGIITLDSLHIATNEHDALYIPENSLQIFCTTSIASGVA
ncbi:unnamed protein product [Sphagnum troendelagicum]|uniref:Uncharacterized protein n=1 Tax=Sphagnum troendelagicum TaxID=128251 RepID=A0ABP0T9K6_9BRYO